MEKELGIYIHIPFCIKKCIYCDFVSFDNKNENVEKYIEKLINELNKYNLKSYNVTTVYIGGGTPSSIPSKYIEKILNNLKQKIQDNKTKWQDIEITIEVNPRCSRQTKIARLL